MYDWKSGCALQLEAYAAIDEIYPPDINNLENLIAKTVAAVIIEAALTPA